MRKLPSKYDFYHAYYDQRDGDEQIYRAVQLSWSNKLPRRQLHSICTHAMRLTDMFMFKIEIAPGDVLEAAKAATRILAEARACLRRGRGTATS